MAEVYEVVVHMEVVFESKIVMKMAEVSRQERVKVMVMHQNPKNATFLQNQVMMKQLSLVVELSVE